MENYLYLVSGKKRGLCADCKNLRVSCLGQSCKHFGNPWEQDLKNGGFGCAQFYERNDKGETSGC